MRHQIWRELDFMESLLELLVTAKLLSKFNLKCCRKCISKHCLYSMLYEYYLNECSIIRGSSLPAPYPNFVRYVSLYATRMLTQCLDNSIYNSVCYAVSNGTRISCLNNPKQIVRGATLLSLSYTHTSNINIKLKSIGERLCENSVEHINIYHQLSIQT